MNPTARPSRRKQLWILKHNLWNTLTGAPRFIVQHPIKCWPILYKRVGFSFWRDSVIKDIETPEGFKLKCDMDLLVYTCVFIERNLYYAPMIKELKNVEGSVEFIDIGANAGLVSQWIGSFNSSLWFDCVELWNENVKRGRTINKKLLIRWWNNAAHHTSGLMLTFNIGDAVTLLNTTNIQKKERVESLAIDDMPINNHVFGMKIDTDGNNINVLEGARETLSHTRWLLIEWESGVEEWMKLNAPGFKLMKRTSPDDLCYRNTKL